MKLFRFGAKGAEKPGLEVEGALVDASAFGEDWNERFFESDGLARLAQWASVAANTASAPRVPAGARLGPAVARPSKVVCIGLNYRGHAKETNAAIPAEPIVFMKASSAWAAAGDDLVLPRGSVKTDWECELAFVIGRRASYVKPEAALDHIAGFAVHNDYSEREYQIERGGQWTKGKSADGFASFGPYLVTRDAFPQFGSAHLWLKVNGQMKQDASTDDLIFDVPTLVSYLSRFMTLLPGDVVSTGTPAGVGMGHQPPVFLKAGDVVDYGIDGLGEARRASARARRLEAGGANAALALLLALGLAGCPSRQPAPAPAPPAPSPAPAEKALRIAMIGKSSTNPIFLSARTGAEAAAKDLSGKIGRPVEVVWMTPPQEDGALQAQRISQAVKEGASAILISCSDAASVTGAIDAAVDAGVAVMTFDSDAPESKRFAYYGVDDHRLGQDVMIQLAKQLGGHGKIAILAGNESAPNLRQRVEGVRDEAARHPGIQIVGTFFHVERPEDAAATVVRVNAQHRDLRGWAMVGGWALFTKTLLGELDPKKLKVVAVDALPPELPYVEKGVAPVLLAQQPYLWGNVGVTKIIDKLVHKKDVPPIVPMDPVHVTQETLGSWARQLRQWGFADVPEEYLKLK